MAQKKINDEMINKGYEMAKAGFNDKSIYEALNISKSLYYQSLDFMDNIKRGRVELKEKISKSIITNATDLNNAQVQVHLSKRLNLFSTSIDNNITLKSSDDILEATSHLYKSVLSGSISDEKFNQLQSVINMYSKSFEIKELEERLEKLESVQ